VEAVDISPLAIARSKTFRWVLFFEGAVMVFLVCAVVAAVTVINNKVTTILLFITGLILAGKVNKKPRHVGV